jgi:hypothetical protein
LSGSGYVVCLLIWWLNQKRFPSHGRTATCAPCSFGYRLPLRAG